MQAVIFWEMEVLVPGFPSGKRRVNSIATVCNRVLARAKIEAWNVFTESGKAFDVSIFAPVISSQSN